MKLVLLSHDLMIASCVEGAARQSGLTTVTVRDQQTALDTASDEACRLLLVDLRLPGLGIEALVQSVRQTSKQHLPIVACGPHVHELNLTAARAAGCDVVVTRGQLDREAAEIISKLVAS